MLERDQIQRFLIQGTNIRGQLISLDASFQEILKRVGAKGRCASILGESLAAISLLASTIKIDGKITLQIRGEGDLNLLVAQATSERTLRGLIRGDAEPKSEQSLAELFQAEHMVLTIDSGGDEPHQGIVELLGDNIAGALKSYFKQSEQLPTQLWLAGNEQGVSGLLLQQLPNTKKNDTQQDAQLSDDWVRVQLLADTLKDDELLSLSSMELLHRLFNEDDVQLFESEPMRFDCSCSKQRSANIIQSLGKEEIEAILQERDNIEIICEFCNQAYTFDAVDAAEIFINKSVASPQVSQTLKH